MYLEMEEEYIRSKIEEYMALGLTHEEAEFQVLLTGKRTWEHCRGDMTDEEFIEIWNSSNRKLAAGGIGLEQRLEKREDGIHLVTDSEPDPEYHDYVVIGPDHFYPRPD